ncbi:response regulator [Algoriphagus sp. C2-6-M1]|uniref:response regulator n=1 Tax=Algoriphagus persicinus TaxID=3108754 RepID=UPI002B386AD4|nr:response regulator [Algoriphagus sp. C2-6-M1]MEB2782041.1 response regulator [Algoriphagus sp. C2-6-M1]
MSDTGQLIQVLVIEDNPGDYLLVEDFLLEKFTAIKITHCKSFSDGKKLLHENVKFSVILLDLILQDLQREKLVDNVQKTFKNTPIIVLTGYTDLNLARALLAKGVSDFLLKDEINPEILYKTVVYAIERENFIIGLENSKNTYQNLFDFTPQPMWLFDNESLLFLDVNEATIEKYGYSRDEFLKMTIKDIRPTSENIFLNQSLAERSIIKNTFFSGIFVHLLKSGEKIQVEIYSRFFEYNSSKATLVLANDITEKLHHMNVIESQNDKLRKIAWTQSHETRAPLARLMGLVNLLEIDSVPNKDVKFLFEQLKLSANELDEIICKMVKESKTINSKNE